MTDALLPWTERAKSLETLWTKNNPGPSVTEREAKEQYETPFNLAFRTQLGYFDWMELPENRARLSEFGRAMTGARLWEVAENIVGGALSSSLVTQDDAGLLTFGLLTYSLPVG